MQSFYGFMKMFSFAECLETSKTLCRMFEEKCRMFGELTTFLQMTDKKIGIYKIISVLMPYKMLWIQNFYSFLKNFHFAECLETIDWYLWNKSLTLFTNKDFQTQFYFLSNECRKNKECFFPTIKNSGDSYEECSPEILFHVGRISFSLCESRTLSSGKSSFGI